MPASVDHLIQRSEFLTAYTPYQPEIAQGTLQYLFEFQTQVALLTGMEVANASMYDGSTATAEAVLMARRVTRRNARRCSPATCIRTTARRSRPCRGMAGDERRGAAAARRGARTSPTRSTRASPASSCRTRTSSASCVTCEPLAETAHAAGALLIVVVTEVVSLGLVTPPGEMGADIVVGEGQSIGNALELRRALCRPVRDAARSIVRQMPGRLAGETVDADGQRGFVLTLSTREQHIRREKATSNICTNSGLCALAFIDPHDAARRSGPAPARAPQPRQRASRWPTRWREVPGVEVLNETFFNEFTIRRAGRRRRK